MVARGEAGSWGPGSGETTTWVVVREDEDAAGAPWPAETGARGGEGGRTGDGVAAGPPGRAERGAAWPRLAGGNGGARAAGWAVEWPRAPPVERSEARLGRGSLGGTGGRERPGGRWSGRGPPRSSGARRGLAAARWGERGGESGRVGGGVAAGPPGRIDGGSAWESNPPPVPQGHGATVLKTARTTRPRALPPVSLASPCVRRSRRIRPWRPSAGRPAPLPLGRAAPAFSTAGAASRTRSAHRRTS